MWPTIPAPPSNGALPSITTRLSPCVRGACCLARQRWAPRRRLGPTSPVVSLSVAPGRFPSPARSLILTKRPLAWTSTGRPSRSIWARRSPSISRVPRLSPSTGCRAACRAIWPGRLTSTGKFTSSSAPALSSTSRPRSTWAPCWRPRQRIMWPTATAASISPGRALARSSTRVRSTFQTAALLCSRHRTSRTRGSSAPTSAASLWHRPTPSPSTCAATDSSPLRWLNP
jgi:hypothetical protein